MNIKRYLSERKSIVNRALDRCLPSEKEYPRVIYKAMRYSVLGQGKRLRPILCLAAAEACGGRARDALAVACAIELIHNYSLIHDDLPAMDDDDERRGRPTCHRKFNEAIAILAGDALLTHAFSVILRDDFAASRKGRTGSDLRRKLEIIKEISGAIGTYGMIGGQVVDIECGARPADLPTLEYINVHKTGALIAASLKSGAIQAGGSKGETEALYRFGKYIGLEFQITDDIIDGEGYALALGEGLAREEAERLNGKAKYELRHFGRRVEPLRAIADFILERKR